MIRRISIALGDKGDVGSTATVVSTKRRWFSTETITETFVCFAAGPVSGGQWINRETGLFPSSELEGKINEAAQAAAKLYEANRHDQSRRL